MQERAAQTLLVVMLICCVVYALPQVVGSSDRYEAPYVHNFMIFSTILIFIILLALFVRDWLIPLDTKIRKAATSNRWILLGMLVIAGQGLALIAWMITWNDEGFNIDAAKYLWANGLGSYLENYGEINKWLGRHHPPLLVLFYGLWYKITGFSLSAGRLLNLSFALGAAWISYLWLKQVADRAIAGLGILLLVATPMWCFSSASALLDMPFLFLFMLAMYFFEKYIQGQSGRHAALAGLFATLAILSRYNGLFLYPIWFVQLLVDRSTRALFKNKSLYLTVLVPIIFGLPWLVISIASGAFALQVGRLSEFILVGLIRPGGWWYLSEVLLPLFPIMLGIFNIPLWIYGAISCKGIKQPGVNRMLAAGLTYLVLIALTLPNPRYVIPALPMLAGFSSVALWRLAASKQGMAAVLGATILCSASFIMFYTWATGEKLLYIFY